jgi:hypothetical protein
MGPTPIEDGKGRGFVAEVDANLDLHTRTRLIGGSNEAEVTADGELLTRSTLVGGGNEAEVDSDGRLLTTARVPCVSKTVYTNYLSGGANVVDTLDSRSDRCSMFFMNTGSNTVRFRLAASDPTGDDLTLAPGEKFMVPFTTDTEVRFVSAAGSWSVVAVEAAES